MADQAGSGIAAAEILSLTVLAVSFIIVVAGGVMAGREGGGQHATLTRLNSQVFIPCLVFSALSRSPITLSEVLLMSGSALLFTFLCYPLALWWVRRDPEGDLSGYMPMQFTSTSTLLLPLSYLLFGSQGLAKAAFFHVCALLLLYTWGMRCTGQPSRLLLFLKTPTLHAVILAVAMKMFEIDLPQQPKELLWLVEKGIGLMAAGALPVLLMSHGYALLCLRTNGAGFWSPAAVVRAVWLPLLATGGILLLRLSGVVTMDKGYDLLTYLDHRTSEAVLLLASAMPCTVTLMERTPWVSASQRSDTLVLSSSIISLAVTALLLVAVNRWIFCG